MFVGITNTPRDYAWGSTAAIAELLGREPSGLPEAELWLGTHPGSPSRVAATGADLLTRLGSEPLPFLLKVLAAQSPLSLQVHPSARQAAAGFARESSQRPPIRPEHRNYQDPSHKPEVIFAVEPFHALCGFRDVGSVRSFLEPQGADPRVRPLLDRLTDPGSVREPFEWLIRGGPGVQELLVSLVEHPGAGPYWECVRSLAAAYPGDSGAAIAILLNLVELAPGEALFLRPGVIHAYLRGVGVELMSASDNVLRGGLTHKHVDVEEMLRVVDFRPSPAPYLVPERPAPGVSIFRPELPDFLLVVLDGEAVEATLRLDGSAIALCTSGEYEITGDGDVIRLERGEAAVATIDERTLALRGSGTLFLATVGAPG